jgi:O-antigen ligase
MRSATRFLLLLFVFVTPWDAVALPLFGSITRLLGLAAIGTAVLTVALEGRMRKPDTIIWLAIAFAGWSALSLLWTISYEDTAVRAFTYVQLVATVWMVREFARTREQQQSLLIAFCVGAFVPVVSLLVNFMSNREISMRGRFSADGLNADDVGLTLAIVIPMAWYLFLQRSGTVRAMAFASFGIAPLAILLTGTRGAFLTSLVALTIVPLALRRLPLRLYVVAGGLMLAIAATVVTIVPQSSWDRVLSIKSELLDSGNMTGRSDIWQAGLQLFPEKPLLGVGAGAYGPAVEPTLGKAQVSHNTPLGLMIEEGIIGLFIFAALFAACAMAVSRMPAPERTLWSVLMFSWLVGVQSVNWESRKVTWLLFGVVAAQSGAARTVRGG